MLNATVTFVLFSLLASSIYVLNDFMDIEEDKKHPTKKNRPLASGAISLTTVNFLFLALAKRRDYVLYLTKDVRVSKETFEQGYEKIEIFRKFRKENNMDEKFNSIQSKRLGL